MRLKKSTGVYFVEIKKDTRAIAEGMYKLTDLLPLAFNLLRPLIILLFRLYCQRILRNYVLYWRCLKFSKGFFFFSGEEDLIEVGDNLMGSTFALGKTITQIAQIKFRKFEQLESVATVDNLKPTHFCKMPLTALCWFSLEPSLICASQYRESHWYAPLRCTNYLLVPLFLVFTFQTK